MSVRSNKLVMSEWLLGMNPRSDTSPRDKVFSEEMLQKLKKGTCHKINLRIYFSNMIKKKIYRIHLATGINIKTWISPVMQNEVHTARSHSSEELKGLTRISFALRLYSKQ